MVDFLGYMGTGFDDLMEYFPKNFFCVRMFDGGWYTVDCPVSVVIFLEMEAYGLEFRLEGVYDGFFLGCPCDFFGKQETL